MRFSLSRSLSHWLYTQNGLNLFSLRQHYKKDADEERNHCNFSFRQQYFYTFVPSELSHCGKAMKNSEIRTVAISLPNFQAIRITV